MTLNHVKIIVLLLLAIPASVFSQDTIITDTLRRKPLIDDDPVVTMLDSLAGLKIFEDTEFPNAKQYQNWASYSDTDVPVFSDSVYRERIAQMNDQSPFEYVYNAEVRKFIELYSVRKRKLTARILGLAQIYFPLFEEQLDKYNMPLELKYLAVIESALNPTANSPAGAKGLWQFMFGTGRVYGLKVSSYVDDRYDPYKATVAACEHLTDLYDIYGNWSLALAAYNSGAGNVNKAIRRSGGIKNFWAIHNYLPRETRSYVPAFIAASYVLTYANEHKIFPVDPGILYYEVDTVTVTHVLTFDQISEMLNIPMDEVEFLNPSFKHGVIPASPENTYKLRLRKKYIGHFINNENALYAYRTRRGLAQDALSAMVSSSYRESELYTVKNGETVAGIAKKFSMTTSELRSLNNMKKNYVRPKQKILVYTKPRQKPTEPGAVTSTYIPVELVKDTSKSHARPADTNVHAKAQPADQEKQTTKPPARPTAKPAAKPAQSTQKYFSYTVQSGDNLWDIADKHNVTVSQIKDLNNLKNSSRLKPGQKIKIPR